VATSIARLTNEWETEYRAFQKHRLAVRDYAYVVRVLQDADAD
jgi:hypothetical protein